jgi:hypothetical protein
MNQYYRPPTHQDVHFPTESTLSANPILDTRWLGGDRSPNEIVHHPIDYMRAPQNHHFQQQSRHTNIESFIQQMQRNIQRHFQPHSAPSYSGPTSYNLPQQNYNTPQPNFNVHHSNFNAQPNFSEEKLSFPSGESSKSEESWPHQNQVVPALNFKNLKGSWKWIPEDGSEHRNSSELHSFESESKLLHQGPNTLFETSRPQTSHDRPYSFDSPTQNPFGHLYTNNHHTSASPISENHHQRYPTGPAAWASSGSDTLLPSEEYPTPTGKHEHEDFEKGSDIKILR